MAAVCQATIRLVESYTSAVESSEPSSTRAEPSQSITSRSTNGKGRPDRPLYKPPVQQRMLRSPYVSEHAAKQSQTEDLIAFSSSGDGQAGSMSIPSKQGLIDDEGPNRISSLSNDSSNFSEPPNAKHNNGNGKKEKLAHPTVNTSSAAESKAPTTNAAQQARPSLSRNRQGNSEAVQTTVAALNPSQQAVLGASTITGQGPQVKGKGKRKRSRKPKVWQAEQLRKNSGAQDRKCGGLEAMFDDRQKREGSTSSLLPASDNRRSLAFTQPPSDFWPNTQSDTESTGRNKHKHGNMQAGIFGRGRGGHRGKQHSSMSIHQLSTYSVVAITARYGGDDFFGIA
ncbi:MAG: hypothetical protein Q9218_005691 [Villophora microphyllina]